MLRVGKGAYIDDLEKFTILSNAMRLPDKLKEYDQTRKMKNIVKKEAKTVTADFGAFSPKYFEDDYDGAEEYSVSGWANWIDPAKITPWHLVFRLSALKED